MIEREGTYVGAALTEWRTLTRRASQAQVSHGGWQVANTVPHAHATKDVVTGVQRGRHGRGIVEVG